jgi:hypothetical protein
MIHMYRKSYQHQSTISYSTISGVYRLLVIAILSKTLLLSSFFIILIKGDKKWS